jgi:hypothetical protein
LNWTAVHSRIVTTFAPVRSGLIAKGVIYSQDHGDKAAAVILTGATSCGVESAARLGAVSREFRGK